MHIAGYGNRDSRQDSGYGWQCLFPSASGLSETVSHHLMYQRKRHRESKSRHKRPHKIVSEFYFCPGQFRQKYCKILSAIIVIDFAL